MGAQGDCTTEPAKRPRSSPCPPNTLKMSLTGSWPRRNTPGPSSVTTLQTGTGVEHSSVTLSLHEPLGTALNSPALTPPLPEPHEAHTTSTPTSQTEAEAQGG